MSRNNGQVAFLAVRPASNKCGNFEQAPESFHIRHVPQDQHCLRHPEESADACHALALQLRIGLVDAHPVQEGGGLIPPSEQHHQIEGPAQSGGPQAGRRIVPAVRLVAGG